jgi:shikimate dehydrogenase
VATGFTTRSRRPSADFAVDAWFLLGAGNVAKALLLVLNETGDIPDEVVIYNRTVGRAESLAAEFPFVTRVGTIDDFLERGEADVLVNVSKIGSASTKEPAMEFTESVVARFQDIADVAFLPLDPPLAKLARSAGKRFAPGYRMFMLQARYVLRFTLGHEMEQNIYEELMIDDFKTNW